MAPTKWELRRTPATCGRSPPQISSTPTNSKAVHPALVACEKLLSPALINMTRSHKGCIVCKVRKVKCDENPNGCRKCQNLGLQCPGYDVNDRMSNNAIHEVVQSVYQRAGSSKRTEGSCENCRKAKSRCDKSNPKCQRCLTKGIECLYLGHREFLRKRRMQAMSAPLMVDDPCLTDVNIEGHALLPALSPSPPVEPWLLSENIPLDKSHLFSLSKKYFERVHPLRCYGFIHRPTFMKALAEDRLEAVYGRPLVLMVCAHGARYLIGDENGTDFVPGKAWASQAQAVLFKNLGPANIQELMALVLLFEYAAHYDTRSSLLMIAACCARAAQLLRLDVNKGEIPSAPTPESITRVEISRRVFWACWIVDVFVAAGVERFLTLSRTIPHIPLPCRDEDFLHQTATNSEKLPYSPASADIISVRSSAPGLESCYIQITLLRGLILRYIKDEDPVPRPWEERSSFFNLLSLIQQWKRDLPTHLQFSETNAYIYRDQNRLAAYLGLHVTFHICHCDMLRTMMPGYDFPIRKALTIAPTEFLARYRLECKDHAERLSQVFRLGLKHGRMAFDDSLCSVGAYESCRLQLAGLRLPDHPRDAASLNQMAQNIHVNLQVLELACASNRRSVVFLRSLIDDIETSGLTSTAAYWRHKFEIKGVVANLTATLETSEAFDHLHPMAVFRGAWKEIELSRDDPQAEQRAADDTNNVDESAANAVPTTSTDVSTPQIVTEQDPYFDGASNSVVFWNPMAPWLYDEFRIDE